MSLINIFLSRNIHISTNSELYPILLWQIFQITGWYFLPDIERRQSLKFWSNDSLFCLHGHSSPDQSPELESCKTFQIWLTSQLSQPPYPEFEGGSGVWSVCMTWSRVWSLSIWPVRCSWSISFVSSFCQRSPLSFQSETNKEISIFVLRTESIKCIKSHCNIINCPNLLSKSFYLSRLLR